jgi:hypothetical protein
MTHSGASHTHTHTHTHTHILTNTVFHCLHIYFCFSPMFVCFPAWKADEEFTAAAWFIYNIFTGSELSVK